MSKNKQNKASRTSATRLASVQSLYEMEISGSSDDSVILDFLHERWERLGDSGELANLNKSKFAALVRGVKIERSKLDQMISGALDKGRSLERLDILLQSILRAGVFELYRENAVPAAVVINEYVDIAHAFYTEGEPALVNAVLDKLGTLLRPT